MQVFSRDAYAPPEISPQLRIFIDVFRGTTTLASLLWNKAARVISARGEVLLKRLDEGYLLVTEKGPGWRDNSPTLVARENLSSLNIVHDTGNLTEAIFANLDFTEAITAGFVNLSAAAAYAQAGGFKTVEIVRSAHFAEKTPAVEDDSCSETLERLLAGNPLKKYPYYHELEEKIAKRRESGKFPAHYWADVNLALARDAMPVVPKLKPLGPDEILFERAA